MKFSPHFFLCFLIYLASCTTETTPEKEVFKGSSADFESEMTTVSPSTDSSVSLKLWAPGPLLANAVGISIDDQGNAYVSQTSRRKSSYLDIREHWDWMTEDLAMQAAADKARFYLKVLSQKFSTENEWLEDSLAEQGFSNRLGVIVDRVIDVRRGRIPTPHEIHRDHPKVRRQ